MMAVICGIPAPVTTRVVQIDPGPIPTLSASAPRSTSSRAACSVAMLPTIKGRFREFGFDPRRGLHHTPGMGVRAVETEHIDMPFDERRTPLRNVAGHTNPGRNPQPAELVLAGVRIVVGLLDVLDRDQAFEIPVLVHHEELLDTVPVEQRLGFFEGRTDGAVTRFSLVMKSVIGRSNSVQKRRSRFVRMPFS